MRFINNILGISKKRYMTVPPYEVCMGERGLERGVCVFLYSQGKRIPLKLQHDLIKMFNTLNDILFVH